MTLTDASGTIQLYCDESRIDREQFETIKNLIDVGDIVGCEGPLKRTDKGELSIVVEDIKVLTKSLRNLPDKWHGLQDVEIKYRQRYVDLIASSESRDTFYQRAQIIKTMRRYLEDELEFMEMETPIMHTVSGGGGRQALQHAPQRLKYGFNVTNRDGVTLEAVSRRRIRKSVRNRTDFPKRRIVDEA
jgi:lysyl-tRNA synthetase class 2